MLSMTVIPTESGITGAIGEPVGAPSARGG
jgi:hypothetical protein